MTQREFALTLMFVVVMLLVVLWMYQREPQPSLPLVEARQPLVAPTPTPCDPIRSPPPIVHVRAVPRNRLPTSRPERTA